MLEIIRNMFRRKLRTSLTVFGIAIGIFALTVMGSMAEKMNLLVDGGIKYATGQLIVMPKGGSFTSMVINSTLDQKTVEKIRKVKGVKKVQPEIDLMLDDKMGASFGMPPVIVGPDLSVDFKNVNYPELDMKDGKMIARGDRGFVVLGIDIANNKKKKVGDNFKMKGTNFKVKGIVAKTLTGPDKMAMISIEDAKKLYIKSDPMLKKVAKENPKSKILDNLFTQLNVSWKEGEDPEKLAKRIEKAAKVSVTSPEKAKKEMVQMTAIFNLVILGSALIALLVGGLSVINTMIMSISERTREIGIKKAVGAKMKNIVFEYVTESAIIGLVGGLIGYGLGFALVSFINNNFATAGNEVFLVDTNVTMTALGFAVFLGTIAGIYPAIHAARLNPVKALRDE